MDEDMEDIVAREEDEQEEEYDENADEDFNPDTEPADGPAESSSSEDEDETTSAKAGRKTKKRKSEAHADIELDSGDEATIKALPRKKRKKETAEDDDSGGEGGFIRTRAQRVAEKEERKHRKRARDGEVTIDVEQLWAELSSVPVGRIVLSPPRLYADADAMDVEDEQNKENVPAPPDEDDMITIKRRIEFAGEITEVTDRVPRSSKEAQKYLAEHPEADPNNKQQEADPSGLQRPLKRPSMFEPNPMGLVKGVAPEKLRPRAPSRLDVLMATKRAEEKRNAQKMSTVQKSALDWRGFVDQEGIREELDEYGKSRGGFLAREAFLDRAAGAREQKAREARLRL